MPTSDSQFIDCCGFKIFEDKFYPPKKRFSSKNDHLSTILYTIDSLNYKPLYKLNVNIHGCDQNILHQQALAKQ